MKIIYHNADLDGHCSGAIVKARFPEADLIGINYGDAFPWEKINPEERIVMVDFSLQPWEDMQRLCQSCFAVTWIDHHKSAIADFEEKGAPFALTHLDTEFAACELCWKEYYSTLDMPLAVYWLGRYDIWKHQEVSGALEFQYGMRLLNTWPDNQTLWRRLLGFEGTRNDTIEIRNNGELLLRYEKEQNKKFASAYAFECNLDGLRCIAMNKGMTNSLVFESVYDPARHDAMLAFAWRNGRWTVSLYSDKPEIDVSAVCKARGGGGHKGAAGFQTDTLPFLNAEER